MVNKPQWKSSLLIEVLDKDSIVAFDEDDSVLLTGSVYPKIAAHLNGENTVGQIMSKVADEVSAPEVMYALLLLEQQGCVREGINGMPRPQAAFWHWLDVEPRTAAAQLRQGAAHVAVSGAANAAEMISALELAGVTSSPDAELRVVLADDYLNEDLQRFNQESLASGARWMLVKPVGKTIWIGPIFRPGITGCWECMAQRLRSNRQMEAFLQTRNHGRRPGNSSIAAMRSYTAAALHLAAGEVAKSIVMGNNPALDGVVLTVDTASLETEKHVLTRRPQCPACGDPRYKERAPKPILLTSSPKEFDADGGHRVSRPEVTYRRLRKHVSRVTGVVNSLKDLTDDSGRGLTYSYSAGHNFALLGKDLLFLMHNLRGRSGGKGCSDAQAKVSAMCEAIERYSGVYRGDEVSKAASFEEVANNAVHPNALMRFSDQQFQNRATWNRVHESAYHRVPEVFDVKRRVNWTPVWSLTSERFVQAPSAYCYYGHPDLLDHFFCSCDANGNAAGNTIEEAILQGFLELVERDGVCLWWYSRVRRPGVDLDSFGEPYFAQLREFYHSIHRDIWVLDITSDLGVPTFAAVSRRTDHPVEDIVLGFGAHFDARLAVLRALTEVNQFLPSVSKRDEKGNTQYWFHEVDAIKWWQTATTQTDPYVLPDANTPARKASAFPNASTSDLKRDVEHCRNLVSAKGMEMLVLDQTQPDLELNVVKVMVPGLRHFWKRFGAGRLYDTPVELGWVKQPIAEEELNPVGIFF